MRFRPIPRTPLPPGPSRAAVEAGFVLRYLISAAGIEADRGQLGRLAGGERAQVDEQEVHERPISTLTAPRRIPAR